MPSPALAESYRERRAELTTYFDRTAADAWAKLTSTAKVSGIRATVRAGRDSMRTTLLSWLGDDLAGMRLLDAGCGTGALAVEAARRGASVVAVDVSPTLVDLARERTPENLAIDFRVGDMLDPALGRFDAVVAMDSLIHYRAEDIAAAVAALFARADQIAFTVAPLTAPLAAMHAVGRFFPRADRAPAIVPVAPAALRRELARVPGARIGRSRRVSAGFYISEALELVRA